MNNLELTHVISDLVIAGAYVGLGIALLFARSSFVARLARELFLLTALVFCAAGANKLAHSLWRITDHESFLQVAVYSNVVTAILAVGCLLRMVSLRIGIK